MSCQMKRSTWISFPLGLVIALGTGRVCEAVPQGGVFPIANKPIEEQAVSSASDGVNFLVGIQGDNAHYDVGAQFVAPDGSLIGPLISTGRTGGVPLLAFEGFEYLLAWTDDASNPGDHIWGMLVEFTGIPVAVLPISQHLLDENIAGVAARPNGFLVTYNREIATGASVGHIYGRIVTTIATVQAEVQLSVTPATHDDMDVGNVASDGTGFLVAWVDGSNLSEIRGRRVDGNGFPVGPELLISGTPEQSDLAVAVGFDGANYVVAWNDRNASTARPHWDVHAQLVSPTGMLVGGQIDVSTRPGDQVLPCIDSDGTLTLVTWTDLRNDRNGNWICEAGDGTCADLYGQYLDLTGALVGDEWPMILLAGDQFGSPVSYGSGKYLLSWTDGALGAPVGGGDVYGTFLPTDGFPDDYCTAKLNSAGCLPEVWVTGIPSATHPQPCVVGCDLVLNNQFGLMLYGYAPNSAPFQGGTLCVHAPLTRTPVQPSGGSPPPTSDCTGTFALDFNLRIQSGIDPGLVPGQSVYAQYWYRDPLGATYPSGLSDAVTFEIQP